MLRTSPKRHSSGARHRFKNTDNYDRYQGTVFDGVRWRFESCVDISERGHIIYSSLAHKLGGLEVLASVARPNVSASSEYVVHSLLVSAQVKQVVEVAIWEIKLSVWYKNGGEEH